MNVVLGSGTSTLAAASSSVGLHTSNVVSTVADSLDHLSSVDPTAALDQLQQQAGAGGDGEEQGGVSTMQVDGLFDEV